ncbi:MAG: family 43 glycosylhydrolase, partial [Clostridia bacterium]|nr:family 43 glycosylhydrolase [Clostridia bacterium]
DGVLFGDKNEPLLFDPSVFIDDDGKQYLYFGIASLRDEKAKPLEKYSKDGCMVIELNPDMLTVTGEPRAVCPAKDQGKGTSFAGHEFYKSPSMRKWDGKYYFVYASALDYELCYATSDNPLSGFTFGGTLIALGDLGEDGQEKPLNYLGDIDGSFLRIEDKYYVFYHRHTNRNLYSRQICAEEVRRRAGRFVQATMTSSGLSGRFLRGIGEYKARIACHLFSKKEPHAYGKRKLRRGNFPYFTQTGKDRNYTPAQHIANFGHGATAGFRYFFFDGANQIIVTIKGNPRGKLIVSETPEGRAAAKIRLTPCKDFTDFYAPLRVHPGKQALYFTYEGTGKFIFKGFTLQQVARGNKYE